MAVCLITLGTIAQPVITYNDNAPQMGDVYNLSGVMGSFDPGPAGSGQNWDFSDASATDSWQINVISPESTPFSGEFPESNMVFHANSSPEAFIYMELSSSEMLHNGNGIDPGPDEYFIHYTDAVKLMQYPFSFNNSYADNYYTTFTIYGGMIHESGNITVTADAWGTVKTPVATYNNTLRIKKEKVYTDSVFVGGIFISATTKTVTDYEWYTATSHYPVLGISVTESGNSLTYSSQATAIEVNKILSQISIYPNPADDNITVELSDEVTGNMEVSIVNLMGQQLSELHKTGNKRFSADISNLPSGVYFIRVNGDAINSTTSKFIKR